jgi:group I intron endonuclease
MLNNMEINTNLKLVSGIYAIICTESNKLYVGKSINLYKRLIEHRTRLRHGKHSNQYLQRSWNKYKEQSFTYCILERCIEEELPSKESRYMKLLESCGKGFNLNIETESGTRLSEITKEKLRIINLGKLHSDEAKAKISNSHKGVSKSKEHRQNIAKGKLGLKYADDREAWNKGLKYNLVNKPNNNITLNRKDQSKTTLMYKNNILVGEFKNYKDIQEQYPGLSQSGISRNARGLSEKYKGYTFVYK